MSTLLAHLGESNLYRCAQLQQAFHFRPKVCPVPDSHSRVNHFVENRRAHPAIRRVRRDVNPEHVFFRINLTVAALHRGNVDAVLSQPSRFRPVFPAIPFHQCSESCISPTRQTGCVRIGNPVVVQLDGWLAGAVEVDR